MIVRPKAERDIAETVAWYDEQCEGLGDEFQGCLDEVFAHIELMPELYRVLFQRVRRAPVRRFPFLVYYQLDNGVVVVVAVMHGQRDPNRWKARLSDEN